LSHAESRTALLPVNPQVKELITSALADGDGAQSAAVMIAETAPALLGLDGAAISVSDEQGIRGTVCASDPVMVEVENLQFSTGSGPCVDAVTHGRPVLVPDLAEIVDGKWAGFAGPAVQAGVRGIFALPLRIGVVRLGAIDLYRGAPGPLRNTQLSDALDVADGATAALLHMHGHAPAGVNTAEWWDPELFFHVEVHQATGMIMVQAESSAIDALARLRAATFAAGRPMRDVARAVVAGELRFEPDNEN
jgi:hypothetical protein